MTNQYPQFKVGDIVEATGMIQRVDKRATLMPGDRAKVINVFRNTPSSPQIIDIEIKGQMKIIDIVCLESVPLKVV